MQLSPALTDFIAKHRSQAIAAIDEGTQVIYIARMESALSTSPDPWYLTPREHGLLERALQAFDDARRFTDSDAAGKPRTRLIKPGIFFLGHKDAERHLAELKRQRFIRGVDKAEDGVSQLIALAGRNTELLNHGMRLEEDALPEKKVKAAIAAMLDICDFLDRGGGQDRLLRELRSVKAHDNRRPADSYYPFMADKRSSDIGVVIEAAKVFVAKGLDVPVNMQTRLGETLAIFEKRLRTIPERTPGPYAQQAAAATPAGAGTA